MIAEITPERRTPDEIYNRTQTKTEYYSLRKTERNTSKKSHNRQREKKRERLLEQAMKDVGFSYPGDLTNHAKNHALSSRYFEYLRKYNL